MPKPLDWLSFLDNDLPILIDFCKEVQEASRQHKLNKAQIRAVAKLKAASDEEFQMVMEEVSRLKLDEFFEEWLHNVK